MTDPAGKRPLHLGCGEGLCSFLGMGAGPLGDMRPTSSEAAGANTERTDSPELQAGANAGLEQEPA